MITLRSALVVCFVSAGAAPLPPDSVAVSPDGATTATHQPRTRGHSEAFVVTNNAATTLTFTITCVGRVNVTCTGTDITSAALAPGQPVVITATYNV